jgi:hypothetical protein
VPDINIWIRLDGGAPDSVDRWNADRWNRLSLAAMWLDRHGQHAFQGR